jgi:hypothetical protein
MSIYSEFVESIEDDNNRRHFQEWMGHNIILNGVVDKSTGKGVARVFRLEEEFELDVDNDMDVINLITKKVLER